LSKVVDPRVTQALSRFAELKTARSYVEDGWREAEEFTGPYLKGRLRKDNYALRQRDLVDGHGRAAKARLTAQLHNHMVNPGSPWAVPLPVKKDMGADGKKWLASVGQEMHTYLLSSYSQFTTALAEYTEELVEKGTSVVWLGTKPGIGPFYQAISLWECYIDENDEGKVDTLFREFEMTAARAFAKWPDNEFLKEKAEKSPTAKVKVLHAVEPRNIAETENAGPLERKWRDLIILVDSQDLLQDENGHDSFPYAVGRFFKRACDVYGYGPTQIALPDIKLANIVMEALMRATEQAADPAVLLPAGLLLKRIDRRPGAHNYYDMSKALLTRGDPVQRMLPQGDTQVGGAFLSLIHDKIDRAFYIDWMTLPDNIAETATAVNDRRDLRQQGLSHMVTRQEIEALDPFANHAFTGMAKENWFEPEPADIANETIYFAYRSPLQLAMQRADVDAVNRTVALVQVLEPLKPGLIKRVNTEKMLRWSAERFGLPADMIASEAEGTAMDVEEQTAEANQADLAGIAQGASAALDGARAAQALNLQPDVLQ
jgi:hypothetical protein